MAGLCGWLPLALDPAGRLLARQEPALLAEALVDTMREGGQRFRDLPKIDQAVRAAFRRRRHQHRAAACRRRWNEVTAAYAI